jgi:hypothetical protein
MMKQQNSLEKKIVTVTILMLIGVFAFTLIDPVISKKRDGTGKKISSGGLITGASDIEIYWDRRGTKKVTSIDWGSLEPGTNKTVVLFILNKVKNQITLSYYTSNWNPSEIADYMSINWDYDQQPIEFREMERVTFTLVVFENVKTRGIFDFVLTIVVSQ